jgi:endonuclease-3 related protein
MFNRLGILNKEAKYDEIKEIFENNLPNDLKIYKEYHALIVEHCKRFCRKKPLCDDCPIKKLYLPKKVYICDSKL